MHLQNKQAKTNGQAFEGSYSQLQVSGQLAKQQQQSE